MTKNLLSILPFLMILLLTTIVSAEYPVLTERVTDFVGALSSEEVNRLAAEISAIESSSSVEIVIVIVESTYGEDRVMYASKLGERNGVGKKATDNGIVLLWSEDDELGGAIATGRGIGSILTDSDVSRIGRLCKSDLYEARYYEGFDCMLQGIAGRLQAESIEGERASSFEESNISSVKKNWLILLILFFIISLVVLSILKSTNPGDGEFRSSSYIGRSYHTFGGFGGGSAGGGFGGGSFGGGGGRF